MSPQDYVLEKDRKNEIVFAKREYIEITGSINAGILLTRILWWYQPSQENQDPKYPHKLRVWKDGYWWLAKERKQWWKECCLTAKEFDGSVKKLKEIGIVITEVHRFNNLTTTHLRVDFDVLAKLMVDYSPELPKGAFQNSQIGDSTGIPKKCIPLTEKTTKNKDIEGFSDAKTTPTPYPLSEVQIGKAKGKIEIKKFNKLGLGKPAPLGENMATATDVLAKHSQKKLEALQAVPQATGVSVLVTRWKQHSGAVGGFAKALTGKESGQLKHLLKGAGPQAIPVIDYAWAHWDKFCSKAKSAKDLDHAPSQPHIGFLVAHYELILQLIAKSKEASAASMQQQIDKPPLVCNNPIKVEEPKAPLAEIEADLAFFSNKE
jgi:hypothetical protein